MSRPEDKLIPIGWKRRIFNQVGALAVVAVRGWQSVGKAEPRARKVLVIEPFGMGDVITLRPGIEMLQRAGFEVTLAAKAAWAPLVGDLGCAFYPLELPWSAYDQRKKYDTRVLFSREFCSAIKVLRADFSSGIGWDPRGDMRTIMLLALVGCRLVYTLDRYLGTDARVPAWVARTVASDHPGTPRWEIAAGQASAILGRAEHPHPPSLPSPGCTTKPHERPCVGLVSVAPWPGRLWPAERWHQLADELAARGCEVAGLCGPRQASLARSQVGDRMIVELKTVQQWVDAIAGLDLLVTLDSGPMHLADALGVPLVALFGPGQVWLWRPAKESSLAIHHQNDPDFIPRQQVDRNIEWGRQCMSAVTRQEVLEACLSLLDQKHEL